MEVVYFERDPITAHSALMRRLDCKLGAAAKQLSKSVFLNATAASRRCVPPDDYRDAGQRWTCRAQSEAVAAAHGSGMAHGAGAAAAAHVSGVAAHGPRF